MKFPYFPIARFLTDEIIIIFDSYRRYPVC